MHAKPQKTVLQENYAKAQLDCRIHAATCKDCYMPIIDDEGNPGYLSECCKTGYILLNHYILMENQISRRYRAR